MKFGYKDILLIILALAVILLFVKVLKLEDRASVEQSLESTAQEGEREGEIAPQMGKLQIFMDKLWFAGSNNNWELASFYAHEMEEAEEVLEDMNATEEGYEINELLEMMYDPAFQEVEGIIKKQDSAAFSEAYNTLLNACNSCHTTVKHGFIQIKVPAVPTFDNQKYGK